MAWYIQFSKDGVQSIVHYSTPPVGYYFAEAAQRLQEFDALVGPLPAEEQAKHAPSRARLQADLDELKRQEAGFMEVLAREGLELREVPETEIKDGIVQVEYEDLEPGKPERGKRISRAFETRAKTWRKLSLAVLPYA